MIEGNMQEDDNQARSKGKSALSHMDRFEKRRSRHDSDLRLETKLTSILKSISTKKNISQLTANTDARHCREGLARLVICL